MYRQSRASLRQNLEQTQRHTVPCDPSSLGTDPWSSGQSQIDHCNTKLDLGSVHNREVTGREIVLGHGFTVDQSVGTVRVAGTPGISETAQTDGG